MNKVDPLFSRQKNRILDKIVHACPGIFGLIPSLASTCKLLNLALYPYDDIASPGRERTRHI